MSDNDRRRKRQSSIAERLQDMLLEDYERVISSGEASAGDRKNLQDLLMKMGWDFDVSNLPQELKTKLTQHINPEDLPDPEAFGVHSGSA